MHHRTQYIEIHTKFVHTFVSLKEIHPFHVCFVYQTFMTTSVVLEEIRECQFLETIIVKTDSQFLFVCYRNRHH